MWSSRAARIFVTTLIVGGLLSAVGLPFLGISPLAYWGGVLFVAVLLTLIGARGSEDVHSGRGSAFLCDSCKYDDPRYCSRPERPNARRCEDYRRR